MKVFGFSITKPKYFESTDGYGVSVPIKFGTKTVGQYLDLGNGSEPCVNLYNEVTEMGFGLAVKKYFERYPPNLRIDYPSEEYNSYLRTHPYMVNDIAFMEELISLYEEEAIFKKSVKAGHQGIVVEKFPDRLPDGPIPANAGAAFYLKTDDPREIAGIEAYIKNRCTDSTMKVYRSLDDFIIT